MNQTTLNELQTEATQLLQHLRKLNQRLKAELQPHRTQDLRYQEMLELVMARYELGRTNGSKKLRELVSQGIVEVTGIVGTRAVRYAYDVKKFAPQDLKIPEPPAEVLGEFRTFGECVATLQEHYGITPDIAKIYMKAWWTAKAFDLQNKSETEPARYRIKQTEPEPPTI